MIRFEKEIPMTVKEYCEYRGCTKQNVNYLLRNNKLKYSKDGKFITLYVKVANTSNINE